MLAKKIIKGLNYRSLLMMKEPYEMTYWKQKLNTPFNRAIAHIKQLFSFLITTKTLKTA